MTAESLCVMFYTLKVLRCNHNSNKLCIFVLVKFCFYAVAFLGEALCHVYLERCNTN